MNTGLSLFCVVAHPADMVVECGGTLALHAARGDHVAVLVLTHGGRTHPVIYVEESRKNETEQESNIDDANRDSVIEIKRAEVEAASSILGLVDVEYLDAEDGMAMPDRRMVDKIADCMQRHTPAILLTHHPGFHGAVGNDHCITGEATLMAASICSRRLSNLDSGTHAIHIKQTFFCGNGVSSRNRITPGGGPINDTYIDITSVMETKIRAIDQFVSQGYDGAYARKTVAGHNGHWGSIAGVPYAEAFLRENAETHDYLPLTDRVLQRDEETMHREYSKTPDPFTIPLEDSPTRRYFPTQSE